MVEGKGKNFENEGLTDEETDAVYRHLLAIDEREFGLTWNFVPKMPVLAHAEMDKRMVTFHLDVFGNIRPGLATDHIIGNVRKADGGVAEVINMTEKWNAFYLQVAKEGGRIC